MDYKWPAMVGFTLHTAALLVLLGFDGELF